MAAVEKIEGKRKPEDFFGYRNRKKRAPARDAFPLRNPQPRILAEGGMFRVGAGRGDCHVARLPRNDSGCDEVLRVL